jgi:hypothetical protein
VAQALRVDGLALVLESAQTAPKMPLNPILRLVEPGFVATYAAGGRALRPVLLRQIQPENGALYGEAAAWVRSRWRQTLGRFRSW